jgi:hypothetical protein
MSRFDGKLTFTITDVEVIDDPEPRAERPNYWEKDSIRDESFEEVEAVVIDYLRDLKEAGHPPSISWAPLSPSRWELVGFHPDYGSAIVDSVYTTPDVAKAIMAAYPDVDLMVFQ